MVRSVIKEERWIGELYHVPITPRSGLEATSMAFAWDSPGEMRQPPAFDRMSHRIRHADRVVRFGYRRRQHHAVAAEFHRQRRVRRGANPCIDNQWNFRLGTDDLQIVWIHDALEPIGEPSGMMAAQPISSSFRQSIGFGPYSTA